MFRASPAIEAWGLRARNPQVEAEWSVLRTTEAAPPRRSAMEWEGPMLQLPEGSLRLLMARLLMLTLLVLTALRLPLLMLASLTPLLMVPLPVRLLSACRVPLLTHRAGPLPVGHWKLITDIQSAKESDPDTTRSPWC